MPVLGSIETLVADSRFNEEGTLAITALIGGWVVLKRDAQFRDDPNDYIIYDRHTGHLYIDVDGNGVEEQILFATLSNKPKLDAEDFW